MMTKNNNKFGLFTASLVLTLILIILLSSTMALGLGIRPAKTDIESDYEKNFEGEFWVVNNDFEESTVTVKIEGEMAKYVKISKEFERIDFRDDDDAKPIRFTVNLPENVPAGVSTANIIVEENRGSASGEGVSSRIVLKHRIVIQGPYPDKYVKAKVNFHERDTYIDFVSEIDNVGKKEIGKVYTKFYVNDKKQEVQTLTTPEKSIGIKETVLLETKIDKEIFGSGEYEVSAITFYDDQQIEVIKKMVVGKPQIDVTYFDAYFQADTINQYTLELMNLWNKRIENVFVDIVLKKDDQKLETFRTRAVDIEAFLRETIEDYFDARGHDVGTYELELQVNFWNNYNMDKKIFEVELLPEEEFVEISKNNKNALAGRATGDGGSSDIPWLWILGSSLMGAAIGYVLYRYKHRDEYEGGGAL